MKLNIKNKGLQGYELVGRDRYTDEELEISIKALQKALLNNRKTRNRKLHIRRECAK